LRPRTTFRTYCDGELGPRAQANIPDVYHCLNDPRETPNFALIGDSKALASCGNRKQGKHPTESARIQRRRPHARCSVSLARHAEITTRYRDLFKSL